MVLLGCLRNAAAVSRLAARVACDAELDITLVCSGAGGGRQVAADDTLVAGFLVELIARDLARHASSFTIDDTATAARANYHAVIGHDAASPTRWHAVLRGTPSGRHLTRLGLAADVAFCAVPDATTVVARATACGATARVTRAPDELGQLVAPERSVVGGRVACS